MSRIEIFPFDDFPEELKDISSNEFDELIRRLEKMRPLGDQQVESGQRTILFRVLLGMGIAILGVSLFLILGQAFAWTTLPDAAISTLIGSVAVEFIGMLWLVVRYLFPQGGREG